MHHEDYEEDREGIDWTFWLLLAGAGLVVLALFTPFYVKPISRPASNACVANLKMLDGAKKTWALEFKKTDSDTPTDADLFGPDRYIRNTPACPQGGQYTLGKVSDKPRCSIPGHTL